MSKTCDKIFSRFLNIENLRMFSLIVLFMMFTPQLGYQVNGFYSFYRVFPYIMFIWVMLLFIYDFFNQRKIFQGTGVKWLVFFLIAYIISTFLNYKYNLIDNLQLVFWMGVQFFLFANFDREAPETTHRKTLEKFAKLFIIITFILVIGGLIMFFFNYAGEITTMDGVKIRSGFRSFRLFGLYHSPNYGSLFACVSIIASTYFIVVKKSIHIISINVINILIQYLYIILSVSRTGKLCLFLTILCGIPVLVYYYSKDYNLKKNIFSILIGIFIALIVMSSFKPIGNAMSYFANRINVETSKNNDMKIKSTDEKTQKLSISTETVQKDNLSTGEFKKEEIKKINSEKVDLKREDVEKFGFSNNRLTAWKEQFKLIFLDKPLFGATSLGSFQYVKENYPESFLVKNNVPYCENDFLKLPVYTGVVGTIIFSIYTVVLFSKVLKYIFVNIKEKNKNKLLIISIPILVLLIFSFTMFFSDAVLMNFTIESVIFWTMVGYITYFVDPNPKLNFVQNIFDKVYCLVSIKKGEC